MPRKKPSPGFAELILKAAVVRLVLSGHSADEIVALTRKLADKAERLGHSLDAAARDVEQRVRGSADA